MPDSVSERARARRPGILNSPSDDTSANAKDSQEPNGRWKQGMLGSHLRLLDQTIPEEERYQSLELDSEDEKDALKADDIAAEGRRRSQPSRRREGGMGRVSNLISSRLLRHDKLTSYSIAT